MTTNLINTLGGTSGFGEAFLTRNDDGSTSLIDIRSIFPNGLNFFGRVWTAIYINNNGNISFANSISTFTPTQITGTTSNPIIAPFWADVDTRGTASGPTPGGTSSGTNLMWYDLDPLTGVITVTWDDVGYYYYGINRLNAFQLQIVKVDDTDFNIVFRYEDINWTTGDASGGEDGLGGTVARAGYSSGDGLNFFELPQSGNQAAILDLENSSNIAQPGTWIFQVRNGAPVIELSIGDVTQVEGNGPGTTVMAFEVFLSSPSTEPVRVEYFTQTGTAGISDLIPIGGTLTFAPGQTRQTVQIEIFGDTSAEANEVFNVVLVNEVNASIADDTGVGTIVNDDGITINDVSVTEGSGAGTTELTFTVTLLSASTGNVSVDYMTQSGSAVSGTDFTAANGTLTFTPGQTSRTVTVTITRDTVVETNETFTVNLSNASGSTIIDGTGIGTIVNDDGYVINDVTQLEGSGAGSTPFVFNVNLLSALGSTSTVNYQVLGSSATAGTDFTAATGTLSFTAGQTQQQITVNVNRDSNFEPEETFQVLLSSPTVTDIADGTGVGTIRNDDGILVSDAFLSEGNAGTSSMVFTVTLSSASNTPVTVDYNTVAGSATATQDYTTTTGTLTFSAGETSKTVNVPIIGDTVPETNETLTLVLSNPTGSDIIDGSGTGIIRNDDGLSISNPASVNEGNTGTHQVTFQVSLNAASAQQVSVDYATGDGTAMAGSDFTATAGTLVFAPGELNKQVVVTVNSDTDYEPNETFRVVLSNAVGTEIVNTTGTHSITNDDVQPPPAMYISNVSQTEGTGAGTSAFVFYVTLSRAATGTVTVDYTTQAGTATAGTDYTTTTGTLSFAAGETTKTITVPVVRDAAIEVNETFTVLLSNLTGNATLNQATGTGTILNDDVTVSINDVTVIEGDSGTTAALFTVTLSGVSPIPVSVDYATVNGTATAGTDFNSLNGTLTFLPGETSKTLNVSVLGDNQVEADENFQLQLSNPVHATLSDGLGQGLIRNDDSSVSIQATEVELQEGDSGPKPFVFTLTRTGDTSDAASVDWTVSGNGDNPATGSDFSGGIFPGGTVNFAPNQTTATITVNVNGDYAFEADEGFRVTLLDPEGTSLGNVTQAGGEITNDDQGAIWISATDAVKAEGHSGPTAFVFTVIREGNLTLAASADWAVTGTGNSPANGADFSGGTFPSGTINFAPGETTKLVTVNVNGDLNFEADDFFKVTLSNAVNATIGVPTTSGGPQTSGIPTLFTPVLLTDPVSALQIMNHVLGAMSGVTLLSAQYTGVAEASALFNNVNLGSSSGSSLVLGSGVLLTSGDGTPPDANNSSSYTQTNGQPGDANLDAFAQAAFSGAGATEDATILQATFTVAALPNNSPATHVSIDLIFGSDEYPEYSSSSFVDIAAIEIDGVNYAYFHGNPLQPLSVINVNLSAGNFISNQADIFPIEYDGVSAPLRVVGALNPLLSVHTIRIAIADTGDDRYDSGIFVSNLRIYDGQAGIGGITIISQDSAQGIIQNDDAQIQGTDGPDTLSGTAADDNVDGQDGIDVMDYRPQAFSGTAISPSSGGFQVTTPSGGTDSLFDVERLLFQDLAVALDLDGNAGLVARLVGTLFGNSGLQDEVLVGQYLSLLDGGTSFAALAQIAVSSDEFAEAAGSHSNVDFIRTVYTNVVGVPPTQGELNSLVSILDSGSLTQAELAVLAANLELTAQAFNLDDLEQNGLTHQFVAPGAVQFGTPEPDALVGSSVDDQLFGLGDNDTLTGNAGSDLLDGGPGLDFSVHTGLRDNFSIVPDGDNWQVQDELQPADTDSLVSMERLVFNDRNVALDLDGNAGLAARLLGVIVGPAGVNNEDLVGVALAFLDQGMAYETLMQLALNAFLGSPASNAAVINLLYFNLVGQAPSQAELNDLVGILNSGALTQGQLGVLAAELPLNAANIDLVGLAATGIEYMPFTL